MYSARSATGVASLPRGDLDASNVEALDECFEQCGLDFCSVMNSASAASGIVLSSSLLSSNRTSIVACKGCLVDWTPEVTPSTRVSVVTEL